MTMKEINMEYPSMKLDIEVYDKHGDGHWAQCKYLAHGQDDVLWTDDIDEAIKFLKLSVKDYEKDKSGRE